MNFNPMSMLGGMSNGAGGANPMGGMNPQMMQQMMGMVQNMFGGKNPQEFVKSMSVEDIDKHTINTMKQLHGMNPSKETLIGILMESGLSKQDLVTAINEFKNKSQTHKNPLIG